MLWASDSETALIEPGLAAPRPICWSFASPDTAPFLLSADEGCAQLNYALDRRDTLVFHHAPYDLCVAAAHSPQLLPKIFAALKEGRIRDTKVRQQLIDIRVGRRKNPTTKKKEVWRNGEWITPDYTLGGSSRVPGSTGLVGIYFGKDRSAQKGPDAWRTRYAELETLPFNRWPLAAVDYAVEDAVDTLAVFQAQFRFAQLQGGLTSGDDPEQLLVNELEQNRASFVLSLISAWGIRTNGETIDELERRCFKVRADIREKLMAHGLYRYEGPKKDPRRKIVKDLGKIKERVNAAFQGAPPVSDKGNIKTDKDTLILSRDPLLEELAEAGPASTVLQTFVPALRNGVKVPSNTQFDTMLDNGRISSSSPNWNNLPRGEVLQKLIDMDVRSAVEPRPGFRLVSVDFDCAELRSHAQVNTWLAKELGWPEPEMAKFFQADPHGDPHLELAAFALKITPAEAASLKKAGDALIKKVRQGKKPTNFGLPGGMGPAKLQESARKSYGVLMSIEEARREKFIWKQRWTEMARYLDYISQHTEKPWDVKQFISNRIRGKCGYSDAANTLWSGLTADGAKHALWNVAQECYVDDSSPLYGSRIILFLYDEIICEVPEFVASAAAKRLTEVMIASMREYLPDIPVTASPALMTKWIKGAEAKYDAAGELVPWDLAA